MKRWKQPGQEQRGCAAGARDAATGLPALHFLFAPQNSPSATSLLRCPKPKKQTQAAEHSKKIKPRLCILPPAKTALGRLRHPPDSSTHKAGIYFLFVFPISQQQSRPVGKKSTKKQRGGEGGWVGINSSRSGCPSSGDFNPAKARSKLKVGVKGLGLPLGAAHSRRYSWGPHASNHLTHKTSALGSLL